MTAYEDSAETVDETTAESEAAVIQPSKEENAQRLFLIGLAIAGIMAGIYFVAQFVMARSQSVSAS